MPQRKLPPEVASDVIEVQLDQDVASEGTEMPLETGPPPRVTLTSTVAIYSTFITIILGTKSGIQRAVPRP